MVRVKGVRFLLASDAAQTGVHPQRDFRGTPNPEL